MPVPDPNEWFRAFTGNAPYPWQAELIAEPGFGSRLIRIPTGFGKTLGVVGAWAYHRALRGDERWPRRLVLCLPMRVLVEQTEAVLRESLARVGLLRESANGTGVAVHLLMGGLAAGEWHLDVDGYAVLIGTQDMLLSRALNRGYASSRARWPVEFGLLHQDALWVLDEVQLMDVGLATSAQLESFVAGEATKALRPTACWWMSATLQRSWLRSVDTGARIDGLLSSTIPADQRRGHLWDDVEKPVIRRPLEKSRKDLGAAMGAAVLEAWREAARGLTLVVVNTVERARAVHSALEKALAKEACPPDLRLVHSRFRPAERVAWRSDFLRRDAPLPANGRIIVATQVVEAGVDLDANLLVTELAPWPSLVQRFGRAARGGGRASVLVLDPVFTDDKDSAPYPVDALDGAREALASLDDVSPARLEAFEDAATTAQVEQLYPYQPTHLLLRREVDELFDTTPDLTGADLDISRYIRSGDERDCTVAWVEVPGDGPSSVPQPPREALCPVPFLRARAWLFGDKGERLRGGVRAWVWDWIDGAWVIATRGALLPGRTVLVAAEVGGYDPTRGFDPAISGAVSPVAPTVRPSPEDEADASQDGEPQSEYRYKTIATHGGEVATEATRIATALGLPARYRDALRLAGLWHDLGKAHPAFQGSIRAPDRPERGDLAKAPNGAWPRVDLYRDRTTGERRPGFRHELASALALFAVLEAHRPDHPALLGPWAEILGAPPAPRSGAPTAAEREILSLSDPSQFDLVAYLVASHHGKVRASLHAAPVDQEYRARDGRGPPIRGVREGDRLPPTRLDAAGPALPGLELTLEPAAMGLSPRTGRSWGERVSGLLSAEGPFVLAFLEACLRAADVRASRLATGDPLLPSEGPA